MNNLSTLYARLDEIPMAAAERQLAKARLAQADALGAFLVGLAGLVRRLGSPHPDPAHWRA